MFCLVQSIIGAVEHNFKALSPISCDRRPALSVNDARETSAHIPSRSLSFRTMSYGASSHGALSHGASSHVASSHDAPEDGLTMPALIFKKLRPLSNGSIPSALANSMEEAPVFDDEQILSAARWPLHFSGPDSTQVDAFLLLVRLKDQIVEACTKCHQACYETRKVSKDMAKRMEQQVAEHDMAQQSLQSFLPEDAEGFGEATDHATIGSSITAPAKDAFSHSQTNLQEPPIEQLEIIGDL